MELPPFRDYKQVADEDGSRNKPVLDAIQRAFLDDMEARETAAIKRSGPGLDVRQVEALERIAFSLEKIGDAMRVDGFNQPFFTIGGVVDVTSRD